MRRRDFLELAAGSFWLMPGLAALAQAPGKMPRIGWLSPITEAETRKGIDRLKEALAKYGWVDGRNCLLDTRFADGDAGKLHALAVEMAKSGTAIFIAFQLNTARELKLAAPDTPMVISSALDPVEMGFAASLGHPGGNITGVTIQAGAIARKRLALLHEALPEVTVLGYVTSPGTTIKPDLEAFASIAPQLGISLQSVEISRIDDFEPAISGLGPPGKVALFIFGTPVTYANRVKIAEIANKLQIPTMAEANIFPFDGALMSYSADQSGTEDHMAEYVDKILRGTKPGDLPFVQLEKFELTVNTVTRDRLGLTFGLAFEAQVDKTFD